MLAKNLENKCKYSAALLKRAAILREKNDVEEAIKAIDESIQIMLGLYEGRAIIRFNIAQLYIEKATIF